MEKVEQRNKQSKNVLILFLIIIIAMGIAFIPSIHPNIETGSIISEVSHGEESATAFDTIYDTLQYQRSINILAMLLAGFGFLMVFIRKHGYSSVTATFLAVSIAIPMYMLIKSYGTGHFYMPAISIETFLFAEFAAASLLIAIGAPLGRLKMDQYLLMGILFIPVYMFNEWLILESGYFNGFLDTGGSVVIHAFGAYFGLGVVSNTAKRFSNDPLCESSKTSSQFCLLGSMILWIFWPSFTSAIVSPDKVVLTAINTVFALCGATIATYIFSRLLRGKIEIEDIANAALAGGVAIGSLCDTTTPGFSLLIGIAAGALSTVGYAKIAGKLEKLIKGTDTCGINNLHGMPGLLGGLTAVFVTGNAKVQLLGIVLTVIVAFIGGKIVGRIINLLGKKEVPYSDEDEFHLEEA